MAQPQPVTDLSPEEMLDCLSFLLRNLRTSNLCETVMRSAKCLSELESDNDRMMQPYLRAVRCVPAFQELDNMAVAHLIKKRAAQGMVAGFTSIHYFFLMLPTPERHNGIKDYDELAGLYRMPAEVLAARSLLHHDPFQSSDPDVAKILETVTKSVKKMGTSNRLVASSGADEGVADLEAGLARLALDYTPSEAGDSRAPLAKHQFLTYLRWVVLGRKASGCPFAKQPTTDGATLRSSLAEKRSTLSDGIIPGSCAMCGSHDAAHQCKLCPISLNEHGSKHIISATTYCNEDCRNFHFEAHKSTCKERRKLARSSVLFMEAFQHYLEVANRDLPFSAITMEQGVVTKHYVPILKPPNSLRALADSKWQADAAMASFACADILYWARPLFDLLIQPCCGTVEFVNHSVKNADIAVANTFNFESLHHLRYNTLRLHTVARLTMPSGSQYAFDPTAAQFGWKEHLAPWDEYLRRRVHHIDEITVPESINDAQLPTGKIAMPPGIFTSSFRAKDDAATELINVFRNRKGGLRAILKLSDSQFEEARRDLTNAMEESVRKLTKTSK